MTTNGAPHPLAMALPSVNFPITICVLAYGRHFALAERLLTSLYKFTDPELFHLRAGLNEAEPATRALFRQYAARFKNITLFNQRRNIFKYPMMRQMFYTPSLTAAWTLWCDDDTHFTRSDWLQRLAVKIETSPETVMWGKIYKLFRRDQFIIDWIKAAPWYRGRCCVRGKDQNGNDAAQFRFATGGFWAIRTDVLRKLNWPDPRLVHVTGDFLLGEALRQNRLSTGSFNYGVKINDAARRNASAAEARPPGLG